MAIYRCTRPTDINYRNYGGRGIKVHPPWVANHLEFVAYLLTLEGHDDPSLFLDRIDNDGHYEPGNLRFVTRSVSARNTRKRGSGRDIIVVGKRYGRRVAIDGPFHVKNGMPAWSVKCDCGRVDKVRADSLRRSIQCGSCRGRARVREKKSCVPS